MKIKIATWNILNGANWEQIINFIKQHKIEILGFQEVDNQLPRTKFLDITKTIAKELRYYSVYGPSIQGHTTGPFAGGEFGNCILSLYPIVESKQHILSKSDPDESIISHEPRTLLEAKINCKNKEINFITLHLSPSKGFETTNQRLSEVNKVLDRVKNIKNPTIITGDFNALPESQEMNHIKIFFNDIDRKNRLHTWPTHDFILGDIKIPAGPKYKIDYIFVSPGIKVYSCKTYNNKISDHAPVVAEVEI